MTIRLEFIIATPTGRNRGARASAAQKGWPHTAAPRFPDRLHSDQMATGAQRLASHGGLARSPLTLRIALVAFGVLNAILYASLMPLWEGFDEPFHYGYVQQLSELRTLPVFGKASLSDEVITSLRVAPASYVVKRNLPGVITFEEYFQMSAGQKQKLREQLQGLPRGYRILDCVNYEAQQAPLAYAVLAPFDRLWDSASLPERVWRLRLICAIFAAVATALLLLSLARSLGLPWRLEAPLIFVVLSGQMFYATTAHIANDWLAAPLLLALFDRAVAVWKSPTLRNGLLLTLATVAGLLTKAYFLAMAPLVLGVFVALAVKRWISWRAVTLFCVILLVGAGPWYARNLSLYRNLDGVQWTNGGTNWPALIAAFFRLPWPRALKDMAFATLWTGNNSYRSFSAGALSMLILGAVAAAIAYVADAVRRRRMAGAEFIAISGLALYGASLLYSATVAFWTSQGAARTATPWQIEAAVPVLLAVLFLGLGRAGALGRVIAAWLVAWSSYIICATYWAKLIPLYAGNMEGRTVLLQLVSWYRNNLSAILDDSYPVMLGSPRLVLLLAAIVALGALALAAILVVSQFRRERSASDSL